MGKPLIYIPIGQGLIGDTLAQIPFVLHHLKTGESTYVGADMNPAVRQLLPEHPHLFFDYPPRDLDVFDSRYLLDLSGMWHQCERHGWDMHMAQGYFRQQGEVVPELPLTFDMNVKQFHTVDLVISPFSRSNNPADNNKLWPYDRWVELVVRLHRNNGIRHTVVLGATPDQPFFFPEGTVYSVFDKPLPAVLYMLRAAKLVITLDNGIGHLCHFGGVKNHVMQYPQCLPPKFAESPFAEHVRGRMPIDISVDQMYDAAVRVLNR